MKKAMFLPIFLLFLLIFSTKARADTYISECQDLDIPGETYYLTSDVYFEGDCFNIYAGSIILDCQNHLVRGDNNSFAVSSTFQENITIRNCIFEDWIVGFWTYGNSKLINVTFNNVYSSLDLLIPSSGRCNVYLENVTRNGLPVAFYNTSVNLINEEYGDLILCDADYSSLSNVSGQILNYFTDYSNFTDIKSNNNRYGIYLKDSLYNKIANSTLLDNKEHDLQIIFSIYDNSNSCNYYIENVTGSGYRPIKFFNYSVNLSNEVLSELILCNADYSNITNVTVAGSDYWDNNGVALIFSDYVNIYNVNSSYNSYGFYLRSSSNVYVFNSLFSNNIYGYILYNTNYTSITKNKFENENNQYHLIYRSNFNNIYNNLFNYSDFYIDIFFSSNINFNVTKQLGERIYSFGNYIGGNYWTNPDGNGYSDTCTDSDRDGFCDNPYNILSNFYDYLPLSNVLECNDGTYRCNNNNVEVCIDGEWVFYQECDYMCLNGACVSWVCDEGSKRCNNSNVEICLNNEWVFYQECDYECYEGECVEKPKTIYEVMSTLMLSIIPLIISIGFILIPLRKILTEGITAENIIAVALAIIIGLAFLVIIVNSIS